jgi:hypothetical protein
MAAATATTASAATTPAIITTDGGGESGPQQFPFKLASAHLQEERGEGERGDRVLGLLWQATDAGEGVEAMREVLVGGLDAAAVALLEDMFGGDTSSSEEEEEGES